eukprot:SAG11_NODE_17192_length_525_cov_1.978873_1_plen_155_part_00
MHVAAAMAGCPKSATTWAMAGMYKAVAKTSEGIRLLVWLFEAIANAEVPDEIVPLLFDSKRMALSKDSQHQRSIESLVAAAERGYPQVAVPGGIEMLTAATEAGLRAKGGGFRKLDEDLKNCFSEMCRVDEPRSTRSPGPSRGPPGAWAVYLCL